MRIVHIIFSFSFGGAETMLVDILNEQSKTEHIDLIIINKVYNKDLILTLNQKIKVHYINRSPGSINPFKIIVFNYRVYELKPNIIHFHDHNAIGLIKYIRRAPTLLTIHGLRRPLNHLPKYDKLVAISDTVKNDLKGRGSFDSTLVYNGVNFSKIKVREDIFDEKIFKIVEVSRLCHEIKGQDILLKALQILIFEKGRTNVQLDFIGEGPSLPYLQNLVKQLKLQPYVNFLGLKGRAFIYNILHSYSLLVQPSIHEGFGLTLIEGMAAKIPVLVSNIHGTLEVIGNGNYGYYFESANPISCAAEIKKIISHNHEPTFYSKLNSAHDYVLNNFSIKKTASEYIKEYHKLAID